MSLNNLFVIMPTAPFVIASLKYFFLIFFLKSKTIIEFYNFFLWFTRILKNFIEISDLETDDVKDPQSQNAEKIFNGIRRN